MIIYDGIYINHRIIITPIPPDAFETKLIFKAYTYNIWIISRIEDFLSSYQIDIFPIGKSNFQNFIRIRCTCVQISFSILDSDDAWLWFTALVSNIDILLGTINRYLDVLWYAIQLQCLICTQYVEYAWIWDEGIMKKKR